MTTKKGTANFKTETIWCLDCLDVMRGMNDNCVDLIYLDPPYNDNKYYGTPLGSQAADDSFKEAWTLNDVAIHEHGELADQNPAVYKVIDAAGSTHSKKLKAYLIFMAIRLIEMKRILAEGGSIYYHCDSSASHYLKLIMDGVFGHKFFRREIIWANLDNSGFKSKTKGWVRGSDTILYYTGSNDFVFNKKFFPVSESTKKRYDKRDGDGKPYKIYKEKDGTERKAYLNVEKGVAIPSVWTDIHGFQTINNSPEYLKVRTQKPLKLLDRIIYASSDNNALIFDPFCGTGTTLVAAEKLGRKWIGCDLSKLAIKHVNDRISKERGSKFKVNALFVAPKRLDGKNIPNYRSHKHELYGKQEGKCKRGCGMWFPFANMEVDHILPIARGGTDHIENLQLLCNACNRSKGTMTMPQWRAFQKQKSKSSI